MHNVLDVKRYYEKHFKFVGFHSVFVGLGDWILNKRRRLRQFSSVEFLK